MSVPLKVPFITYILREAGMPFHTVHKGSIRFGQKAEAGVRGKYRPETLWGFCEKGKAGQCKQFRIG